MPDLRILDNQILHKTYPRHFDWMNEPISEVKGGHDVIMA